MRAGLVTLELTRAPWRRNHRCQPDRRAVPSRVRQHMRRTLQSVAGLFGSVSFLPYLRVLQLESILGVGWDASFVPCRCHASSRQSNDIAFGLAQETLLSVAGAGLAG